MNTIKPYLAKFAIDTQQGTARGSDKGQDSGKNGASSLNETPRPTSATFVRNETTDDQ
jgi:hypothetical protein